MNQHHIRGPVGGWAPPHPGGRGAAVAILAVAASLIVVGCSTITSPERGAAATVAPSAAHSPTATPRATPSLAPRPWPAPIQAAMSVIAAETTVPLEAPRDLPLAETTPNSVTTSAGADRYQVTLYHCPRPLPANAAGVGNGSCGAMANLYGGFGGSSLPSAAAAAHYVLERTPQPPPGCVKQTRVQLQSGLDATLFSVPASGRICLVAWHEGDWTMTVDGDPGGGVQSGSSAGWMGVAKAVVSYLNRYLLPPTEGSFVCDLAPDGLHTSLTWAVGSTVYTVEVTHGAVPAAEMAVSMSSLPS